MTMRRDLDVKRADRRARVAAAKGGPFRDSALTALDGL